jgi:hypothetical protein
MYASHFLAPVSSVTHGLNSAIIHSTSSSFNADRRVTRDEPKRRGSRRVSFSLTVPTVVVGFVVRTARIVAL